MGYSITIIGHKAVEAAEDAIAFEQSIVDKVKAFVDELEGVVTASGSFEQLGGVTLKSEETTDGTATPEPTPPLASEDPNNPNPQPEATPEPTPPLASEDPNNPNPQPEA